MRKIRTTNTGAVEYWCSKTKRTVVSPNGYELKQEAEQPNGNVVLEAVALESLTDEELLSFAEKNGIDIPPAVKKRETIMKYIDKALK